MLLVPVHLQLCQHIYMYDIHNALIDDQEETISVGHDDILDIILGDGSVGLVNARVDEVAHVRTLQNVTNEQRAEGL